MSDQQNSSTRLLVSEHSDDGFSTGEADETFVIRQALREVSIDEHNKVYRCLSTADISLDLPLPVYQIAWKHITHHRRGRLHEMVLVYTRLTETIEAVEPDQIVCSDDLDPAYRAVLIDVGAEYDIEVSCRMRPSVVSRLQRFVISSILLAPFFLDQLLGLVLKRSSRMSAEPDTVFVPGLSRLGSMTPVFEEMDTDFEVIVASMASSWLWTLRDDVLDPYDPIPLSQYATVGSLFEQLSIHFRLCWAVFFSNSLKHKLESVLSSELDVSMDRAVDHALQQGFRARMFGSLHLYSQFGTVFEELGCDNIVIGSLSPAGRTIIAKGIANGVGTYHIPHGIGAGADCPNPPAELTQFVSGKLEKRYYNESPQVETPWNCVVTGRPYLTELYESYATDGDSQRTTEPYHIVLATQANDTRIEFVEEALAAIDRAAFEATVTIKIHPSETADIYTPYAEDNEWITVAESNLHELLADADLTLTVNSNVGLESIVVGTPSVSLNWWGPVYPKPMYAEYGGVPVVDDTDMLDAFFGEIDDETLADLLADETAYIHEFYELTGDAHSRIAAELEADHTDVDLPSHEEN